MHVLVTNDDGIKAPGIAVLIEVAREMFEQVTVAAPRSQKSAVSQAITINKTFRIFDHYGPDSYGIDGTPADCVFYALRELVKTPPDLVLSGINLGPNMGYDTLYSGTVAGAREGLMNGIPSVSFSLAVTRPVSFDQARPAIRTVLGKVVAEGIPDNCMLNVNIPAEEMFGKPRGYKVCTLGTRVFANQTALWKDPIGQQHGWIGGRDFMMNGSESSDCHWLQKGYVTLTPLTWNLSCPEGLQAIAGWENLTK